MAAAPLQPRGGVAALAPALHDMPVAVTFADQALPLLAYSLLLLLSLWRLAAHWPAGCCWRQLGGRLRRSDRAASTRLLLSSVGLGLSLALALTEAHGGTLDMASVPGQGTTVSLSLPLKPQENA